MQYSPFYRIVPGADTAVLFVHGIVGTPAHFRFLTPLVPERWSVYNILLEGHGGTVEDFACSSMVGWKLQVHETLKTILSCHKKVFLVGHSMGTLLCIQESFLFPDRILGLFLLNVPLHPWVRLSSIPHTLSAAIGRAEPGSPAEMLLMDCGVHLSPQLYKYLAWLPRYLELIRECLRVRPMVKKISHPCICIQSSRDELVSGRSFSFLLKHQNLSVSQLSNSGHFAYLEGDQNQVGESFVSFLEKFG